MCIRDRVYIIQKRHMNGIMLESSKRLYINIIAGKEMCIRDRYIIDTRNISVETMYSRSAMAAKKCKDKYMTYTAFYDNGMAEELFNKQELINDMREALDNEQFVVYFQPKYSLKKKAFCGAEALVRWNHPRKGFISPGEFIPIFEQNGFIAQLDYYVWEHTCIPVSYTHLDVYKRQLFVYCDSIHIS